MFRTIIVSPDFTYKKGPEVEMRPNDRLDVSTHSRVTIRTSELGSRLIQSEGFAPISRAVNLLKT